MKELPAEPDAMTEEDWVIADEAAITEGEDQVVITVPTALLPAI